MQISYSNKASYSVTTVSSSVTGYGIDSMYDIRLSKLFKFSANTGCWIKVSTPIKVDRVFIAGHNLSSAAVITLEGNDTDDWTSPSLSESVAWKEGVINADITSVTYNYWRLTIEDETGATLLSIGYLFFGEYFQMPEMTPDQQLNIETTSKASISASGQIYGDTGYEFRNPVVNFPALSNTQRLNLITMFKVVRNVYPFFMVLWNNNKDVETVMYCVIEDKNLQFKKNADVNNPYSISIKFREVF